MEHASAEQFRGVYYYLFAGIALLIAAFLFVAPTHAQTVEGTVEGEAETSVAEQGSTDVFVSEQEQAAPSADIIDETPSADAVLDETVTEADLGLAEPVKAPGAFHFVKRWGRALQEATTFDATKKNELRLKNANIDFLEGKKAAEEKGDFSFAEKSVERAEKRLGKITESIKNQKGPGDARSSQLLDSVLDNHIKQQKILGAVEAQALQSAPEFASRFHDVQERAAEHAGEALTSGEQSADQVTERINRVFSEQQGSEFRDLRNLEVLQQLEDHVPEQARAGIERAQDAALHRFSSQIEQIPEQERGEKFNQYTRHFGGDKTRHLQMFEQMKQFEGLPPEIQERVEAAKDNAASRFQAELEGGSQEFRDQAFARFRGNVDPNKLRVISDLIQRVHTEDVAIEAEIKDHESKAIDAFVAQFPDDEADAAQFKKLSEEMASNPNPDTWRIIQKLEEKVKADPKKAAFIAQMEQQTKQQFAKRVQEHGDRFLKEIAETTNPEDIAIFEQLKSEFFSNPDQFFGPPPFGDFGPDGGFPPFGEPGFGPESAGSFGPQGFGPPPGFASFFDRAIQKNAEVLTKNIQQTNDPVQFEQFQRRIQSISPELLQTIQKNQGDFQSIFQQKRDVVAEIELRKQEQEFQKGHEQERLQQEMQIRARFESAQTDEERAQIQAEVQAQDQSRLQQQEGLRRQLFLKRVELDPFCDANCRAGEASKFETRAVDDRARFEQFQQFNGIQGDLRKFEQQRQAQFGEGQGQPFPGDPSGQGQFPFGDPGAFGQPPQGFDPSNPTQNQPFPNFEGEHGPFPPPSGAFNPVQEGFVPGAFPPSGQGQEFNNSGSGSQGKNQPQNAPQNSFLNQKNFLNNQNQNQNVNQKPNQQPPQFLNQNINQNVNQNKDQALFENQNTKQPGFQEPKPFGLDQQKPSFQNQPFPENEKSFSPEPKQFNQPKPFFNEQPLLNQPKPFNEPGAFEKTFPTQPSFNQPNQPSFNQPNQPSFQPFEQPKNPEPQPFQPQNNFAPQQNTFQNPAPAPFSPPPGDQSGSSGSDSGTFTPPPPSGDSFSSGPSSPPPPPPSGGDGGGFSGPPPSGEVHGIFGSFLQDVGQGFTIVRALFTRSVTAGTGFFLGK